MITLAHGLRDQADSKEAAVYADVLAQKSPEELRALGKGYIESTRIHRKTDRPFFIDKMPNNFLHIGLIHTILPNAKIIDARRHPLGCCFSNFKQFYARGQNFSYSLEDIGHFYRDYVGLTDGAFRPDSAGTDPSGLLRGDGCGNGTCRLRSARVLRPSV